MWCDTLSYNGFTILGCAAEFPVHQISAFYGTVHAASLTAVLRAWTEYVYERAAGRFVRIGRNVLWVEDRNDVFCARKTI